MLNFRLNKKRRYTYFFKLCIVFSNEFHFNYLIMSCLVDDHDVVLVVGTQYEFGEETDSQSIFVDLKDWNVLSILSL